MNLAGNCLTGKKNDFPENRFQCFTFAIKQTEINASFFIFYIYTYFVLIKVFKN